MAPRQSLTSTLVAELDRKFPAAWDLYRLAVGGWAVKVKGEDEAFKGETIEDALQSAVDFVPLPRIPRVPTLLFKDSFSIVKSGSKWDVHYNGGYYCGGIMTERKAEATIDHHVAMAEKRYLDWLAEFGCHYQLKDEGVTFRWAV